MENDISKMDTWLIDSRTFIAYILLKMMYRFVDIYILVYA